jgi:hypothetical protein
MIRLNWTLRVIVIALAASDGSRVEVRPPLHKTFGHIYMIEYRLDPGMVEITNVAYS